MSKTGVANRRKSQLGESSDTLTERAYARLEDLIVTLELTPGAVLSENGLSLALGIGRTPIREALQRLAREGLVRVHPRKAIIVTETDPASRPTDAEVRRELERLLSRLSAERASASERAQFEAIAAGMLLAARATDDIAFLRLDRDLNDLLADAAHNEFALRSMRVLNGHSEAFSGICTTRPQPTCRRSQDCMRTRPAPSLLETANSPPTRPTSCLIMSRLHARHDQWSRQKGHSRKP